MSRRYWDLVGRFCGYVDGHVDDSVDTVPTAISFLEDELGWDDVPDGAVRKLADAYDTMHAVLNGLGDRNDG